jgi:hypothetical protein
MRRERRNPIRNAMTALARSVTDRVKRWRGHPPQEAGVREPRRPRPTLPAAAVALDEPRVALYRRWVRLNGRRDPDR